jgi:protein serine/threonine phosphatase
MGGLANGELASATVIREFDKWFRKDLPAMLEMPVFPVEELRLQWDNLVLDQNKKLADYASSTGTRMGTTVVAFLIVGENYYIMNIGDSRAYMITDAIYQLTKDQTYVQFEMDAGRMTWEEAQVHPQRNVLLQCIGASEQINPDYFIGQANPDTTFLLCSDGFRHLISPDEIYEKLKPEILDNEDTMLQNAISLIELNKTRKEVDNISVAVIRTCREG